MCDEYILTDIYFALLHLVETTGKALLDTPLTFLEKNGLDVTIIRDKMMEIRSLVREFQSMTNDPLSLQYNRMLAFRTDNVFTWYTYYYMDTVSNVVMMRDSEIVWANTVYVGNDYVKKLNMIVDKVEPETLVIDSSDTWRMVPFLPSVRKIFIVYAKDGYINLDNYLDTITDLNIVTEYDSYEYYLSFIRNSSNLEVISIEFTKNFSITDVNVAIEDLAIILRKLRTKSFIKLRVFKLYINILDDYGDLLFKPSDVEDSVLLEELELHELEGLEMLVSNVDEFVMLINSLPSLKTLMMCCYSYEISDILEGIINRLSSLERLEIVQELNAIPGNMKTNNMISAFIAYYIPHLPKIKEVSILGTMTVIDIVGPIKEHIEKNLATHSKSRGTSIMKRIKNLSIPSDKRTDVFNINLHASHQDNKIASIYGDPSHLDMGWRMRGHSSSHHYIDEARHLHDV